MSHTRYQAAGFQRDDIVVSGVHRTVRAAADAFFETYPNLSSCIVKRVRVTVYGDVRTDPSFSPKKISKISA